MTTPSSKRLAFAAVVAAFLAGCSGASQSALSPSQSIPQSSHVTQASQHGVSLSTVRGAVGLSHPSTGKSWMDAAAKGGQALMYVSEVGNGTVNVYNYKGGKSPTLSGTLTGFAFPAPPCTDNKGNTFIPDYSLGTISEYAYGSSTPSQVLDDTGYAPFGCSVDPTTGNLAVANFGGGTVSIFAGATGTPTTITISNQPYVEFVAYDKAGNLFAAGRNIVSSSLVYQLDEAPSGTTKFNNLTLSGFSVAFPGQIQWGGTYLLVGDQGTYEVTPSSVNQVTVSGTTATLVKNVPLTGTSDVIAGYKRGSGKAATYAAPNYEGYSSPGAGYIFSFPGGTQTSTFASSDGPYGAVITQKGGSSQ